jgi:hypothetical protein
MVVEVWTVVSGLWCCSLYPGYGENIFLQNIDNQLQDHVTSQSKELQLKLIFHDFQSLHKLVSVLCRKKYQFISTTLEHYHEQLAYSITEPDCLLHMITYLQRYN